MSNQCIQADARTLSFNLKFAVKLLIDSDMRNIFALTSVLESHEMKVSYAENGKDGITLLKPTSGIDLVLMDIMMPEMDGYETIRKIRKK